MPVLGSDTLAVVRYRGLGAFRFWTVVGGLASVVAVGCGPQGPYVRYDGTNFGRPPKPVDAMEVFRFGVPSGRFEDIGTVSVSCPSFGDRQQWGGCDYGWAVHEACTRASSHGGDGVHGIETAVNTAGSIVSLRASVFVRLPPLAATQPVAQPVAQPVVETRKPTVEERLRKLDKLKQDGLINQDEYQQKRQQILNDI
jgi:hypothetical protein